MRKLLLLLFVCFCGYGAMAQLPVNVGIHGGVSTNKMKLRDLDGFKTGASTGYMIGAFVRVNLGNIYLEPSFNFAHKKNNLSSTHNMNEDLGKLKINSFEIPLMVGFKVLDLSIVKFRAFLGPVVSFPKLKGVKQIEFDSIDKTNWRAKIGVGVDVWKLTFDIDYDKAFEKLGHEIKAPRSFNFTLGMKII